MLFDVDVLLSIGWIPFLICTAASDNVTKLRIDSVSMSGDLRDDFPDKSKAPLSSWQLLAAANTNGGGEPFAPKFTFFPSLDNGIDGGVGRITFFITSTGFVSLFICCTLWINDSGFLGAFTNIISKEGRFESNPLLLLRFINSFCCSICLFSSAVILLTVIVVDGGIFNGSSVPFNFVVVCGCCCWDDCCCGDIVGFGVAVDFGGIDFGLGLCLGGGDCILIGGDCIIGFTLAISCLTLCFAIVCLIGIFGLVGRICCNFSLQIVSNLELWL
uniref:Uncharacterized protein n=1 Tax=Panstrongylus lignarius TaxID=156445 RepID=A0A224XHQ3_9HEMI